MLPASMTTAVLENTVLTWSKRYKIHNNIIVFIILAVKWQNCPFTNIIIIYDTCAFTAENLVGTQLLGKNLHRIGQRYFPVFWTCGLVFHKCDLVFSAVITCVITVFIG